ncbi:class I SAM-dependent methyltransferase [Aetokthonos hydrillicola Thurmond2011]|jgi:ubiquinone/menaquinone biosynthesis C-methylase UbiE|uniref:Class I SAM-dependent methyltransferase n=1 Tax=Aetokthonos hydrillicola Thurmond2011 TaxID=2712845 RepID=A0AAP5IAY3_9CYAN|nr:class I SAM-dependent methyltransferase [Aetokthonos hydrillicola]MBO3464468.1 class I SAM-dependent methyltransferase [Aetokthonos hydrillicola CCALA 1050]MBW4587205.1 class I SAM-dependent methyltransferase [Aetokthonos hydrillicola CCALA 1050]MDR9896772.1 class I SAM-dependent methyltransferase [Aetokthonos hydrillicola Thurmond2011]
MSDQQVNLPYFDQLLALLDAGHPEIELAFGRHVHWGYWLNPEQALNTPEDFGKAAEQLTREVYSAANVKNGQAVLDVGCGLGGTIASLNEHFSQMNLVGLNIDGRQLEQARKKLSAQNGNTVRFEEGNACMLPFPDQSFDVVLAVECIFHFPDRRQFFQEAFRVLKPNGYLALSDFVPTDWLIPFLWDNKQLESFYGQWDVRYTAKSYAKLAAETGFRQVIERNITVNTLPTYQFLWTMKKYLKSDAYLFSALSQTFIAGLVSQLDLMRYMIFSFRSFNT